MDIGNLDNLFQKKRNENATDDRVPTKGKEPASLNDMMGQVGDYDMPTSSTEETKHRASSNSDYDDNDDSYDSSKHSAKRAAVNAIATAASVIAPTTVTASVVPPRNEV